MGEIVVGGGLVGDSDDVAIGALGGEGAGVRIFEGDGFMATEAEAIEDEFVEVGLGFGRGGVFAAGEEIEMREQAEALQVRVDPGVLGVGGETDVEAGGAGGGEEIEDAGENGLAEETGVLGGAAFELEGGAVRVRREAVPGVEAIGRDADAADEKGAVEGDLMARVDFGVGVDEGGLGVEDETVEVEDEGADHAMEEEETTKYTKDTKRDQVD